MPSAGFSILSNQYVTWIRIREKMVDLGEKNENPCFENFSEVPSQKLALGEVEESQRFLEVKQSKYKNGFFTMSSLDLKLSETIFGFPIG